MSDRLYPGTSNYGTGESVNWMDKLLGYNTVGEGGALAQNSGFAAPIMSGIGTGINAWMGNKALGLAEDQFDFQKDSFNKNYEMMLDQYNRGLNNTRLQRQVSQNPNATMDERQAMGAYYDTGANQTTPYGAPVAASAFAGSPQTPAGAVEPTTQDRAGRIVRRVKKPDDTTVDRTTQGA